VTNLQTIFFAFCLQRMIKDKGRYYTYMEMEIAVTHIFPHRTVQGHIGVRVSFSVDVPGAMFPESATVEVYVEPSDSYTEIRQRAVDKAREFLSKAVPASASENVP
jgi:hypothetical protein